MVGEFWLRNWTWSGIAIAIDKCLPPVKGTEHGLLRLLF